MYKEILRSLDDAGGFAIIAILIFFIFFVFVLIKVMRMEKHHIDEMAALPNKESWENDSQPQL